MPNKKKTPSKKSTGKNAEYISFKKSPDALPFLHFRYTPQTTYWIIISLVSLMFGMWILVLTIRVNTLYDQVQRDSLIINSDSVENTKK